MGDWAQLTQSVILGLIISYLLAKLISMVITIKEDNLFLTHHHEPEPETKPEVDSRRVESSTVGGEADWLVAEQSSSRGGGDSEEEDDDWEGVESTELDEAFCAAADRLSRKVPSDVQQKLYGLYKIATEGPCTSPQPSALKLTARAKWQTWKKLGAMPPEEAMEKKAGSGDVEISNSGGTMAYESKNELKIDAIHAFAREGEVKKLLKSIESGSPLNARGQTPLHYAVVCDREEFLVKKKANTASKDDDGNSPLDLCGSDWP